MKQTVSVNNKVSATDNASINYNVKLRNEALQEWRKLDKSIQQQFVKQLKKCCENPYIPSAKIGERKDCYKIKLPACGFRLVYQVTDNTLIIAAIAVGKREHNGVYHLPSTRMRKKLKALQENQQTAPAAKTISK